MVDPNGWSHQLQSKVLECMWYNEFSKNSVPAFPTQIWFECNETIWKRKVIVAFQAENLKLCQFPWVRWSRNRGNLIKQTTKPRFSKLDSLWNKVSYGYSHCISGGSETTPLFYFCLFYFCKLPERTMPLEKNFCIFLPPLKVIYWRGWIFLHILELCPIFKCFVTSVDWQMKYPNFCLMKYIQISTHVSYFLCSFYSNCKAEK